MRQVVLALCLAAAALFAPALSWAQTRFDPFAGAEVVRALRGHAPNAMLRVEYRLRESVNGQAKREVTLSFWLASDWALVQEGERRRLLDFRLGREFEIATTGETFFSSDISNKVAFRAMELQNRAVINQLLEAAGASSLDDCDAETELAIAIPGFGSAQPALRAVAGGQAFFCNDRAMGGFSAGTGTAPPASFWPTLANEAAMHPALLASVRASGAAPSSITIEFVGTGAVKREWTLTTAEAVDAPYPLLPSMTSANAASMDKAIGAGVGAIAAEAVAGRAMGGAPTFDSWDRAIGLTARNSPAEAAMLLPMSLNMFPALEGDCAASARYALCDVLARLRATTNADKAVKALMQGIVLEQNGRVDGVVDLMVAARESRFGAHPALMQSYALALLKFNQPMRDQAKAAGLPTEPMAIMAETVKAYPYNPAYWTDIAGVFAVAYRWREAGMAHDVALALPMPDAQDDNPLLRFVRDNRARLRADFPAYFALQ